MKKAFLLLCALLLALGSALPLPGRAKPQGGRSPCPGVQHLRRIGSRACRF